MSDDPELDSEYLVSAIRWPLGDSDIFPKNNYRPTVAIWVSKDDGDTVAKEQNTDRGLTASSPSGSQPHTLILRQVQRPARPVSESFGTLLALTKSLRLHVSLTTCFHLG